MCGHRVSVMVQAELPRDSPFIQGTVFLNFDDGRKSELTFRGRALRSRTDDFFIELGRAHLGIPLLAFRGPVDDKFWDRAPPAEAGLMYLLANSLYEVEDSLHQPEQDGVNEVIRILEQVFPNFRARSAYIGGYRTCEMDEVLGRRLDALLFPAN